MLRKLPSLPMLLSFYCEQMLNFVKCFSASIDRIMGVMPPPTLDC